MFIIRTQKGLINQIFRIELNTTIWKIKKSKVGYFDTPQDVVVFKVINNLNVNNFFHPLKTRVVVYMYLTDIE